MTELHIALITESYRQNYLLSNITPANDHSDMVCRLVKGWLQYLPKEERIIFYEYHIKRQSLQQIASNMKKRWELENYRTTHELELRLSWAIQRILSLMDEQFPDFDLQYALT